MVPDRDVGTQLAHEVDHRLGLGFARRAAACVLRVARHPDRAPLVREVPVQVDAVVVRADLVGAAIGVHRLDDPQLDALGDRIRRAARRRSRRRRPRRRGSPRSRGHGVHPTVPYRSATIGRPPRTARGRHVSASRSSGPGVAGKSSTSSYSSSSVVVVLVVEVVVVVMVVVELVVESSRGRVVSTSVPGGAAMTASTPWRVIGRRDHRDCHHPDHQHGPVAHVPKVLRRARRAVHASIVAGRRS